MEGSIYKYDKDMLEGILTSVFLKFAPHAGEIQKTEYGSMVSMATGKALAFSLGTLQDRGVLYIGPTTEVYEGMVIGYTSKGDDMTVNPTKGKQLTNMRASGSDDKVRLAPPKVFSLEECLEYIQSDEYVEVTPKGLRIRKIFLKETDRKRSGK